MAGPPRCSLSVPPVRSRRMHALLRNPVVLGVIMMLVFWQSSKFWGKGDAYQGINSVYSIMVRIQPTLRLLSRAATQMPSGLGHIRPQIRPDHGLLEHPKVPACNAHCVVQEVSSHASRSLPSAPEQSALHAEF